MLGDAKPCHRNFVSLARRQCEQHGRTLDRVSFGDERFALFSWSLKMKHPWILACIPMAAITLYACGDNDTTPNPVSSPDGSTAEGGTGDGGGGETGAGDSAVDAGVDAMSLIPCAESDFSDFTGPVDAGDAGSPVGPTIGFPTDDNPVQYTNRCVKIHAGGTVTWSGRFDLHPLEAFGGTSPTPIPAKTNTQQDGGALTVTFPSAGTYGFRCNFHPFTMNGAVKVVP
jgi:plastocyanin